MNAFGLTVALPLQLDWTIEIGDCELGVRGWEGQTQLLLGIDNFTLPISGDVFRMLCLGALVALAALASVSLWRRTQAKPPATAAADQ